MCFRQIKKECEYLFKAEVSGPWSCQLCRSSNACCMCTRRAHKAVTARLSVLQDLLRCHGVHPQAVPAFRHCSTFA